MTTRSDHSNPSANELTILLLRVALGVIFVVHALIKIVVYTLPGTVAFFESAGFPGASAYLVTAIELVAGALLVVGFQTRWAALSVVPVMLGATWVHLPNGFTFNNQGGGWEFTAFLAVVAVALAVAGQDGPLSLGRRVGARG